MFVLDTNVISEFRKIRGGTANPHVARWAELQTVTTLYLSVITIEELEIGVRLAERNDPAKGAIFRTWLDNQVIPAFPGRILPIDLATARRSATLHIPNPRPIRDAHIAATALVHGMTVVTRNLADFTGTGVPTLDPWQA